MKTSVLFVSLLLAVTATAAPQNRNGGFRGGRQRQGGGRQQNGQQQAGQQQAGQAGQGAGQNGQQAGNQQQGGQQGNNNAGNGGAAGGDPQTSLTLDPKVIADGFKNNGQSTPEPGQVASLTSSNNFINFCLTAPNTPITNGKQITTGSCNPAPIGLIPNIDTMPSSKFTNPKNGDTVAADQPFQISMAVKNLNTGNFVNAQENYFAAPQQLDGQGQIVGHTHVVVELLDQGLAQSTPTDPKKFAFFKGVNGKAQNGIVTADVTNGLPAGTYRLCSINAAANHQPVIVPVAQHGSLDDCVYFTSAPGGAAGGANNGANGGAAGGANNGANGGANGGAAGGANNGANGGAAGQQGQQGQGQQGATQGQQGQGQQGAAQGQQGQQQGQNRGGRGGRGGRNRQQRSLLSRASL
ncbi:hypothetical protein VNI00_014376 [Paramarasmius palmivorus]|uniref:Ribosomal protein s17 n=1 Tax=Paramarasmius palmivorus TaxID=297713 RepID=A0AAW0BRJ4_9AGAR